MRAISVLFCVFLPHALTQAQVLAPEEIRDPEISAMQRKYLAELKLITKAAAAHTFPYRFYFSRALDLPEKQQPLSDQRSVQFDRYKGQVVLKITGNYFASYSADLMSPQDRARKTYEDVMLPLLDGSVKALASIDVPEAFALEISHHVRKKVLGVSSEGVENVVLILSKDSAQRLVAATDPKLQQAAVLEGQTYLNAVPISLWPQPAAEVAQLQPAAQKVAPPQAALQPVVPMVSPHPTKDLGTSGRLALVSPEILAKEPVPAAGSMNGAPFRDTSPEAMKSLQNSYQSGLDKLVQEVNTQANFVRYAPPAFIPFHNGLYLQLSITTVLPQTAAGSHYKLAALAFDQHVAHLIRPVLAYFKTSGDFDGIDFSTSVRLAGDQSSDGSPLAVEFIFPIALLRSYSEFDCTGQQLIDASFVLINGERISLNLQMAEAAFQLK